MRILDLAGPQFLGLYVVLLVVAWTIAHVARNLLRPPRDAVDAMSLALKPVEIGYLADGEKQALDAAMTSMAQRKLLAVDPARRSIAVVAAPPTDADSLERRLYTFFGKNGRTIENARAEATPLFAPMRERLTRAGFLIPDEYRWMARWIPSLLLGAVLALGVAKVKIGVSRDRPVGFLVLLCALTGGEALRLLVKAPQRSIRGDNALAAFRAGNEGLHVTAMVKPDRVPPEDMALAVGLYGAHIIRTGPMSELGTLLDPPPRVTSSLSSGGGGSCSSCSSSSCGGGCGGGGCGGCGA